MDEKEEIEKLKKELEEVSKKLKEVEKQRNEANNAILRIQVNKEKNNILEEWQ